MPTFKGVTIQVTDAAENPLEEWGCQTLRKTVSCYIQSETDQSFKIRMQAIEGAPAPRARPGQPSQQLLAELRLDGRAEPERRRLLNIDPTQAADPQRPPRNVVMMDGRMAMDNQGVPRLYRWVFRELGIESLLQDLSLTDTTTTAATGDDATEEDTIPAPQDPLTTAFQQLGANQLENRPEAANAGVIEVTLRRVYVVTKPCKPRAWPSSHAADGPPRVAGADMKHLSHTTGTDGGEIARKARLAVHHWPVDATEDHYAKFKFFYRSEAVLRKYDFAGFPAPAPAPAPAPVADADTPATGEWVHAGLAILPSRAPEQAAAASSSSSAPAASAAEASSSSSAPTAPPAQTGRKRRRAEKRAAYKARKKAAKQGGGPSTDADADAEDHDGDADAERAPEDSSWMAE